MLLTEILRPGLIKVGLEAQQKREAIGELVDLLVQEHEIPLKSRESVLEAVLSNEAAQGTGMESGIAVPHGLTDEVEDLICAMGISKAGVPFESLDGAPAKLVILVVAPKRSFAAEIRTLAGIQHLMEHDSLGTRLMQASNQEAAFDLIQQEEAKL
jgi:mannitol/fructose-specific phosphotransferase system IIA component (Ntr-type)